MFANIYEGLPDIIPLRMLLHVRKQNIVVLNKCHTELTLVRYKVDEDVSKR